MAGIDVFRSLLASLRATAMTPVGTVKPKCSGIRTSKYPNHGSFTWEEPKRPSTSNAYILCADLPASSIRVHLLLDGDQIHCDLTVNLNRGREFALYNQADTDSLESLIGSLRELALWL